MEKSNIRQFKIKEKLSVEPEKIKKFVFPKLFNDIFIIIKETY